MADPRTLAPVVAASARALAVVPPAPPENRARRLAAEAAAAALAEVEALRALIDRLVAQADLVQTLPAVPAGVRALARQTAVAGRGAGLNIDAILQRDAS